MMMDLESLLGGDGEAFATIDDLDGLLNDYAAAPGAAVAPGAPEIAFPKAVLKESASRDTNTYSHDSSCASPQSASDAFAPKATLPLLPPVLKIEQLWQAGPVKQQSSEEAPVKQQKKRGRKAKPVVDLNSITDERERKRQRRLMKNRLTAAMSREA